MTVTRVTESPAGIVSGVCRRRHARAAWLAAVVIGGVLVPGRPVIAEDAAGIRGEMHIELHNDWTAHSDDPDNERNDANTKIETSLEAPITDAFSLKSLLTLETVRDPDPGQDRFFGDEGLYAQELFGEYQKGAFGFRAGKFGQKFGIAWDAAPGIWGTDFAEDYELAEQIGVAADYHFGGKDSGEHTVTLGTFFADTTFLSQSVITGRGRARKSDGGAGNTEDFSSFSLGLEGEKVPVLSGLRYQLAYLHRGVAAPGESAETGYSGTLSVRMSAGAVDITPLVEYVSFQDRAGTPGTDARYLTTSLGFEMGPWNLALSRTARDTEASAGADVDDRLFQVSGGYTFENGLGVNLGWKTTREDGVDSDTYGLLVDYTLKF